jgi:hypothetical protein
VELSLDMGDATDMEKWASRRIVAIWNKCALEVIDRDRDGWLDGMRDIHEHEHDFEFGYLEYNLQRITTWTFLLFFPRLSSRVFPFR